MGANAIYKSKGFKSLPLLSYTANNEELDKLTSPSPNAKQGIILNGQAAILPTLFEL